MSFHNFKEKDRVKVYATLNGAVAETKGTITRFRPDGMLYVNLDGRRGEIVAHPKQCRRLKPKKRLEEIWVKLPFAMDNKPFGNHVLVPVVTEQHPEKFQGVKIDTDGWRKFREVKEK